MECEKWNKVVIGKCVQNIVGKVDFYWVKWVNYIYLRG